MNANNPLTLPSPSRERGNAILIIGVGNDFRGDDAAGLVVVRRLKEIVQNGCITVMELNGDGSALIESWKGMDKVIIIDAVKQQGRPGTICRFEIDARPRRLMDSATTRPRRLINQATTIPQQLLCSTHAFGVAEAIELGRAMNKLPPQIIVYGIEGGNFNAGQELSHEVEKAIAEVLSAVTKEVQLCLR